MPTPQEAISARQEILAYTAGLQGYIYGYPVVDYLSFMKEHTQPGAVRGSAVNALYSAGRLMGPGEAFVGRAPNNDTIYFYGWLDLRSGPVMVHAPAIPAGRYHALTFADLYSEVQHTGARVTGNDAQTILVAGPDWNGPAPAGTRIIRMRTRQAFLLGRMLAIAGKDEATANELIKQYRVDAPPGSPQPLDLPDASALQSVAFFSWLNRFLRENPRLPGEEALMAQFDSAGFGPGAMFDEARLSPAARRGFERGIADARRLIASKRFTGQAGWSRPTESLIGNYGYDYLQRAYIEQIGLLANQPAESVYPSVFTEADGTPLSGERTYRIRFTTDRLPPVDAFWSLTAYDARKVDFFPNALRRYSIGDRTPGLVRGRDGSIEIIISHTKPRGRTNWLPVGAGPLILTLRMYQPKPAVLEGRYTLPPVEVVEP